MEQGPIGACNSYVGHDHILNNSKTWGQMFVKSRQGLYVFLKDRTISLQHTVEFFCSLMCQGHFIFVSVIFVLAYKVLGLIFECLYFWQLQHWMWIGGTIFPLQLVQQIK